MARNKLTTLATGTIF